VSAYYLETLLARLVEMETVAILPAGRALTELTV
jgi:hypothetical protein